MSYNQEYNEQPIYEIECMYLQQLLRYLHCPELTQKLRINNTGKPSVVLALEGEGYSSKEGKEDWGRLNTSRNQLIKQALTHVLVHARGTLNVFSFRTAALFSIQSLCLQDTCTSGLSIYVCMHACI